MNVIKVLLLVSIFSVLLSCKKDPENITPKTVVYESYGLPGYTIHKLKVHNNFLYAATTKGIWRRTLTLFGAEWENIGFKNSEITAMLVLDENNILISTYDEFTPETSTIYKTTNGGQTWAEWQGNFGEGNKEPVYDIIANPNDTDILYAVGTYVVAKSEDGGLNWTVVWGSYGSISGEINFIALDPDNPAKVWAGGKNPAGEGALLYSNNSGANGSWSETNNIMINPSTAKALAFEKSTNAIFTGWEGALLKANGNGNAWETVINADDNRFFNGILIDPDTPGTVYAAGFLEIYDAPQALVLYRSKDSGVTWEDPYIDESPGLFGGVMCMEYLFDGREKNLFLGSFRGGVYRAIVNN